MRADCSVDKIRSTRLRVGDRRPTIIGRKAHNGGPSLATREYRVPRSLVPPYGLFRYFFGPGPEWPEQWERERLPPAWLSRLGRLVALLPGGLDLCPFARGSTVPTIFSCISFTSPFAARELPSPAPFGRRSSSMPQRRPPWLPGPSFRPPLPPSGLVACLLLFRGSRRFSLV